jgi:hypothetical protein
MEKNVPNQFFNPLNNFLLFGQFQILNMKRLLLLLVLAFYCAGINAQETRGSQGSQVMEVNAFMANLRASEGSSRNLNSNSSRLENLLKEVQPAIYFRSGEIRLYGENPTSLYIDVPSLRDSASRITANESIEIVTISLNQISDLSSPIDLTVFSNFPNLKYIYILSTVETSGNVISSLIRNSNSRFGVFYKVDKGS